MAAKAYTGIILSYNKITKSGSILVDASSDPLQPNIFFKESDLPNGFVFIDTKYESNIIPTSITLEETSPARTIQYNKEVLTKDQKGKLILKQTKVSFNYDTISGKISNLTIL